MNFLLHNRIEISNGKEKVFFYNKMLKSVIYNLKEFKSYNSYIALGTGLNSNYSETNFKLEKYLNSYPLETEYLQDDINGNEIYIKKTAIIDDGFLDGKIISEAGLSDGEGNNPTIFNYFQFSIDDNVIGIEKQKGIPLVISIYIYLDISKTQSSVGLLTAGKNKFIDFLLGEGLKEKIYIKKGRTLIDNSNSINRDVLDYGEPILCDVNINVVSDGLTIEFCSNIGIGEIYELVMLIGNQPFARIYTINESNYYEDKALFSVKANLSFDIGENIKEIVEIKNINSGMKEEGYICKKYSNSFGDKIHLPFNNIFDSNTPRFLSKDGKMIFFVLNNKIYGYKNDNHSIIELDTSIVNMQNIVKVISFENYVFVVSKSSPFLSAFLIDKNKLEFCNMDLSSFEDSEILSSISNCDMTISRDNKFLFGFIEKQTLYGYTLYFSFDTNNKTFSFESSLCSEYKFNYVLAMLKNDYTDAMIIFLKSDESSFNCKIIYHYPDKTFKDLYSSLSYYLTYDTKEIYVKDRAIVVEKVSSPKISLYLYPDIIEIQLNLSESNKESYISTNLNYLIQNLENSNYKMFNLLGYNLEDEFVDGIPCNIDKLKILDVEILDDVILFFMDNEKEKILAYNLFDNKSYISNVSSNDDNYEVLMKKYKIIGKNEEIFASFKVKVFI